MNPNFDHVRDQILIGQEVPFVENLTTWLLHVPTLKSRNIQGSVESFSLISTCGNGGRGPGGGRSSRGRPQCTHCKRMGHTQENCYSLHDFVDKIASIL